MTNVRKTVVGKPKGKRSLGKPGNREEDNIKLYLRQIGFEIVVWILLA
jgi:hypothetical protein